MPKIKINGNKTVAGVIALAVYLVATKFLSGGAEVDPVVIDSLLGWIGLGALHKVAKIERAVEQ